MTNDCWAPSFWHSDYDDYFGPDIPEDEPEQCEECKKTSRKKLRKENKNLRRKMKTTKSSPPSLTHWFQVAFFGRFFTFPPKKKGFRSTNFFEETT